jgi:2-hydroxy-3-keto-5-methylthiopentenyl-1-phosphate phosphatase
MSSDEGSFLYPACNEMKEIGKYLARNICLKMRIGDFAGFAKSREVRFATSSSGANLKNSRILGNFSFKENVPYIAFTSGIKSFDPCGSDRETRTSIQEWTH